YPTGIPAGAVYMELEPQAREQVFPLPVVLISTISKTGIRNIAPYSNFSSILRGQDHVILASWMKRDTLDNIRETKEFVVNIPPASMVNEVMICSRHYPPEIDEFEKSGFDPHNSKEISVPGITGSLAWMECRLVEEIVREHYSLIIGSVLRLEVDESFFRPDGMMDYAKATPLSVMLGTEHMEFTYPVSCGRSARYEEMFLKG
ncbi:MAG: flavin reductase family protein, partial [Methanospirillum sp.]|nr:flavin reductase family protein [Methanospirillum sp.]